MERYWKIAIAVALILIGFFLLCNALRPTSTTRFSKMSPVAGVTSKLNPLVKKIVNANRLIRKSGSLTTNEMDAPTLTTAIQFIASREGYEQRKTDALPVATKRAPAHIAHRMGTAAQVVLSSDVGPADAILMYLCSLQPYVTRVQEDLDEFLSNTIRLVVRYYPDFKANADDIGLAGADDQKRMTFEVLRFLTPTDDELHTYKTYLPNTARLLIEQKMTKSPRIMLFLLSKMLHSNQGKHTAKCIHLEIEDHLKTGLPTKFMISKHALSLIVMYLDTLMRIDHETLPETTMSEIRRWID